MASANKSKHAFGARANIQSALASGAIDAYDILFLNEGLVGWVDRDGNVIIPESVIFVDGGSLPETGKQGVVYIYNNELYIWDGSKFVIKNGGGVSESAIDEKISKAKEEITQSTKESVDEAVSAAISVVEF